MPTNAMVRGRCHATTYAYDPAGNRTGVDDGATAVAYAYTPANRLVLATVGGGVTTYQHDAAGHRTAVVPPSGASTLYAWDAAGQLVEAEAADAAGPVTFTYDADGRRVAKVAADGSATGYLYDLSRLLHETDEVGGEVSRTYASDTTDEFGDLIGEEGEFGHVYDAMANTDALLDEGGAVEARYKYYAFGAVAAVAVEGDAWSSLSVAQWSALDVDAWASLPLELTSNMLAGGKKQYYRDPETELYLLGGGNADGGGRYYDPATARFVSEDPDRQGGGGDANLYPYVGNDPVNKLDPSGHAPLVRRDEDHEGAARDQQQAWQESPSAALGAEGGGRVPFVGSPEVERRFGRGPEQELARRDGLGGGGNDVLGPMPTTVEGLAASSPLVAAMLAEPDALAPAPDGEASGQEAAESISQLRSELSEGAGVARALEEAERKRAERVERVTQRQARNAELDEGRTHIKWHRYLRGYPKGRERAPDVVPEHHIRAEAVQRVLEAHPEWAGEREEDLRGNAAFRKAVGDAYHEDYMMLREAGTEVVKPLEWFDRLERAERMAVPLVADEDPAKEAAFQKRLNDALYGDNPERAFIEDTDLAKEVLHRLRRSLPGQGKPFYELLEDPPVRMALLRISLGGYNNFKDVLHASRLGTETDPRLENVLPQDVDRLLQRFEESRVGTAGAMSRFAEAPGGAEILQLPAALASARLMAPGAFRRPQLPPSMGPRPMLKPSAPEPPPSGARAPVTGPTPAVGGAASPVFGGRPTFVPGAAAEPAVSEVTLRGTGPGGPAHVGGVPLPKRLPGTAPEAAAAAKPVRLPEPELVPAGGPPTQAVASEGATPPPPPKRTPPAEQAAEPPAAGGPGTPGGGASSADTPKNVSKPQETAPAAASAPAAKPKPTGDVGDVIVTSEAQAQAAKSGNEAKKLQEMIETAEVFKKHGFRVTVHGEAVTGRAGELELTHSSIGEKVLAESKRLSQPTERAVQTAIEKGTKQADGQTVVIDGTGAGVSLETFERGLATFKRVVLPKRIEAGNPGTRGRIIFLHEQGVQIVEF